MEGGDLSTEGIGDSLSPCADHQGKYNEECCADQDLSLTLENEEHHHESSDNIFRTTSQEAELEIEPSESLNAAAFGVRREDVYGTSHATSPERLSLLVTMLALVLSGHAMY